MAKEIRLPDIGDFKDVPIIEILVAPGQSVRKDETILTLESDKASMDVPAPEDGVIGEIRVKVGDKVTQGDVLATYSGGEGTKPAAAPPTPKAAPTAGARGGGVEIQEPAPKAAAPAGPPPKPAPDPGGQADFEADILVLGAGPGGYTAAFRAADLGQNVVLVDARPTLGGVCLNVGCIPSKALLHVAKVIDDAKAMGSHGVSFGAPTFDAAAIRGWKDGVVKKLTGGLIGLAKQRKVKTVTGEGKFTSANTLRVETAEGARVVRFNKAIIAAGSEPAAPGFIPADPRIWDFDRGARDQFHSQAHAGARRRDHRARDGDGLPFARRRHHRDRDDGPTDAGGRSGHCRPARQAHRPALREDPAEDEGDRHQGRAGRA